MMRIATVLNWCKGFFRYLRKAYDAEEIIREWFGEGGKPDPQAQDRADVCSGRLHGRPCPYNYLGRWIMPDAIAGSIKRIAAYKQQMCLRVEGEELLGHCECCHCVLSLKVHVPRKHIMNHTTPGDYAFFPSWCWIKTEESQ